MWFMRRTSRQGLAKRATAEPAVLKRDPRYGQRPPSHALNQGSRRAVHAPHVKTGACEKSDRGTCRLEAGSAVWTTAAFPKRVALARRGANLSLLCFFLFALCCSVLFWFVFSCFGLFCEKQLPSQVKLGVAVLLCCALPSLFLDVRGLAVYLFACLQVSLVGWLFLLLGARFCGEVAAHCNATSGNAFAEKDVETVVGLGHSLCLDC